MEPAMPSLTLKNVPEPLLDKLRDRASSDRRSLNQEVLYLLEEALWRSPRDASIEEEIRAQVEVWSRLAGRWKSDLPVDEEIAQILGSRTGGRQIDL